MTCMAFGAGTVFGVEEADELLMAMALHAAADDLAVDHVKSGEQRGRAVALVVVRHGAGSAALHRQAGLRAVERLDLALLVDRQHLRVGRRIDVEADDVADLGRKGWIVRQLEGADAVRLKPVGAPDALHIGEADACCLDHGTPCPVRDLAERLGKREGDDPLSHLGPERGDARRARLVAKKAVDALCREALLPAPDRGLALARPSHDGRCAETVCCRQHDRGPPDMLLRAVTVRDDGMKPVTVRGGHFNGDPGAHAPDSHASIATGIPTGLFRHHLSTSSTEPSDHLWRASLSPWV